VVWRGNVWLAMVRDVCASHPWDHLCGLGWLADADGEPSDNPRNKILEVVKKTRDKLAPQYGPHACAYQFAQVGSHAAREPCQASREENLPLPCRVERMGRVQLCHRCKV